MGAIVGIDLGTTNSAVAAVDVYGRPVVLPNREGDRLTPSAIGFGSVPHSVGREAREWARVGLADVATDFKPQMGNSEYRLRFGDRDFDATELSSIILGRLKVDAQTALGRPVDRAVIAVPAYFADPQRKATIEAARRAGLSVDRLINEPTAAALAYGLGQSAREESILVYDLGGGTFDVTVARVGPGGVEVLATAGDHDLGGRNWDDRLAAHLAERFLAETGSDPLDDPASFSELLSLAEGAKWTLSARSTARVALQLGTMRRSFEIGRAEFEAMTRSLVDRTRRLAEEALAESRLEWARIDGILLVGGATRMPMVRALVRDLSGKDSRAGVNVDEAVALGAAIRAAMDEGAPRPDARPSFTLGGAGRVVDVMSHSLGVVAVREDGASYVNDTIIRRNSPIPAEVSRPYLHQAGRGTNDRLEVYLTQGESPRPLDCTILGKYVFGGFRPTDEEVAVEVRLSYDASGVIGVVARRRDDGERLTLVIEPVPEDLEFLDRPPELESAETDGEPVKVFLLIDVSASMAGTPLMEVRRAARAFLEKSNFARAEVGLISFSDEVRLEADATAEPRRILAAIERLEADGTTNLADAIALARERMLELDRRRYLVILTDGFPDAAEAAVEEAGLAREAGIEIVAIGTGGADRDYLRRIASTDEGSIFAPSGQVVAAFGHIARIIGSGGRGIRTL